MVCYSIATRIYKLFRKRINVIGEFSREADWLRNILGIENIIRSPWLYDPSRKTLYGGRALVARLIILLLKSIFQKLGKGVFIGDKPETCSAYHPCTYISGLIYVLKYSKKIRLLLST